MHRQSLNAGSQMLAAFLLPRVLLLVTDFRVIRQSYVLDHRVCLSYLNAPPTARISPIETGLEYWTGLEWSGVDFSGGQWFLEGSDLLMS